jgi:hypothetical protein
MRHDLKELTTFAENFVSTLATVGLALIAFSSSSGIVQFTAGLLALVYPASIIYDSLPKNDPDDVPCTNRENQPAASPQTPALTPEPPSANVQAALDLEKCWVAAIEREITARSR